MVFGVSFSFLKPEVQQLLGRFSPPFYLFHQPVNPDTLKFYKDLIQFRKEQPATRQGSVIPLINDRPKRVVSYLVKQGDSGILCVLNLFSRLIRTVVQLPANFNLKITGSIFPKDRKPQKTTVKNNKLKINLGRYDSFVFPFRTTPG